MFVCFGVMMCYIYVRLFVGYYVSFTVCLLVVYVVLFVSCCCLFVIVVAGCLLFCFGGWRFVCLFAIWFVLLFGVVLARLVCVLGVSF